MADDKLSWIFELVDKMTGPASKIEKSLGKLGKAAGGGEGGKMSGFAKMTGVIGKLFGGKAAAQVVRFGAVLDKFAPELKAAGTAGKGLFAVGSGVMSVVGGIASVAATVGAVVGGAVLGLAAVGTKYALEAFSFKENTMAGFETMLKSKQAAARVMADAVQFAAVTPFGTQEVIEAYRKLMVAGFKEGDLRSVMTTVGDVGAAFGQEAMQSVIRGMAQIKAKGKLQGEELMQLSEAGVGSGAVFDALAKKLGKTREQVQKLVSAGKVDSDTGIAAILEAITTTVSGGKAGSLMEKQSQTISGLLSTLESKPFEFFLAIDESKVLAPAKGFISAFTEALDPKTAVGGRIVALLQTIGNAFGSVFGDGQASAFEMSKAIGKVLDVVEPLVKFTLSFGDGFFKALKPLAAFFSGMEKMDPKKVENIATAFAWLGAAVAGTLSVIVEQAVLLIGYFGSITDASVRFVETVRGWFSGLGDLPSQLWQMGANLVQGFIDGITSMVPNIGLAVGAGPGGMAAQAIETVKAALDQHSPSRVFADIGANTTLGYIEGIQTPDLPGAMADTFSPSSLALGEISAAAPGIPAPSVDITGMAAGGRTINVNVTINASGGTTREQAEELADLAVAKLNTALEQAAMEIGVQ